MGDGGFWHNGLITGVASNLFNKGDGVLIIMQNGYASATGQQFLPSSAASRHGAPPGMDIERTLRSLGVTWLRKVRTYGVAKMVAALKDAMQSAEHGLKVIIADGECQLARQRRVRAEDAEKLKRGARVVKTRYGVDDVICTGDHSCIRLVWGFSCQGVSAQHDRFFLSSFSWFPFFRSTCAASILPPRPQI